MSSSTFTPSETFDPTKERDWQANLGMLDWDSTKIVFTKRSLLEFLKSTGTTVDPNFTNLSKLPRYATFGKLGTGALNNTQDLVAAEASGASHDTFIPTRRVRDPPGGKHHDIFANDQEDDALSTAPPKLTEEEAANAAPAAVINSPPLSSPDFKPSRRVRQLPGGQDSISGLWDDDTPQEQFKPTRRVRQGPGGTNPDHVTGIF